MPIRGRWGRRGRDSGHSVSHHDAMPRDLPSGTVTFLFTDIEGSTKLLHELGPEGYAEVLAEHRRTLRDAFSRHGGVEVDTQGDAFFIAFPSASGAVQAAQEAQHTLAEGPIRVRMGLHTGTPHLTGEGYVGAVVHMGARIASAGHGGQVLLSKETREAAPSDVTDLGEHRLKDFDSPVWIFQLGSEHFPPLKTISNTNLPRPASTFVGREREVGEVASLLRDGARLLTLTGPGGSGKTRLSIEAASELVPDFRNGVFWVPLAPLRDPALVAETIGTTLGAKDGLTDHVGERDMLLLLDNFEQVVDAAPELSSVLEACPNLHLLVTSRELLRVRGEVEYPVLPLADPEAVELFCARSRLQTDQAIAELCRRLDNLPLALELAAARTNVLSPEQILERLSHRLDLLKGGRDAEARQLTLRATIAWSHDLLTAEEQRLFARLSVFRGGCTLEATEDVAEADLDVLQSLVDKSLLRHSEDRFWMLETIREYAAERLEESGEATELRRRHASSFLALAEEAFPHLRGNPGAWLDRLDAEHDNLSAALEQLEALGEPASALQLAGALYRYWYTKGHLAEGRRRLEGLLRIDDRPTAARARALHGAAVMEFDPVAMRLRAEEALALHRRLEDAWGIAYSTYLLGMAATEESNWRRALPLLEESLAAFRELGDEHYTLLATDALAWVYGELGDRERRRALHENTLRQARAQGNMGVVALQLDQLASDFALAEGRIEVALSMLGESLRINRDLGRRGAIAENLCRFAHTLAVAGITERAARLLAASEALREEIGGGPAWVADMNEETHTAIHAQVDQAAFSEAWEQGRKLTVDDAVALALGSLH
jgi:predicted ATPase/class 3 adenylate cyclase